MMTEHTRNEIERRLRGLAGAARGVRRAEEWREVTLGALMGISRTLGGQGTSSLGMNPREMSS